MEDSLGKIAETLGGLLILSQPEVLARDSLPLAYAAGCGLFITQVFMVRITESQR